MTGHPRNRFILLSITSYVVCGLLWILLSDHLLLLFADADALTRLSTAKGVFFVIATAALFFFLLRAVPPLDATQRESLLGSLTLSIDRERRPHWLLYVFAVVITAAVMLLRLNIPVDFAVRPMLILFMLPIVLCALLGGLGPGLFATALTALATDLAAEPHFHSAASSPYVQLQWASLVLNGIGVSLLSALLRQSLAKQEVNRRLLDAVVSGTTDAVFVKDEQGRYLLVNAAAAAFVGKPVRDILGRDDREVFDAASAQALMSKDRDIMAAGAVQTAEERLTLPDGKAMVFLVTKGPMFDGNGRINGLFGISRDITERKRIDDELRYVLNEASDAIWVTAADGRFLFANPAACRLSGHPLPLLEQLHFVEILAAESQAELPAHLQQLQAAAFLRREWQLRHADGHQLTVELTTGRMQDGRYMIFGRDLTEKMRAELALQEREQQLARVIDGSDQGYWDWNLQTNAFEVSARWETMLGYAPGEMVITVERWPDYVHPEDLPRAIDSIQRHLSGAAPSHEVEIRCLCKSGAWRWMLSRGRIVSWDAHGLPLMMSGTHTDITERKLFELALKEAAVVFDSSYEGIMVVSPAGRITKVNAAFSRITGYRADEAVGQSPKLLSSGQHDAAFYREMWDSVRQHDFWRGEIWNRRRNGDCYPEQLSISVVRDELGQVRHYVGIFSDISQLKAHEAELERIAHFDPLTGLPNRRLLSDRLGQAIRHTARSGKSCAVCFLDLDGFKAINDQYGHAAGDQLLIGVTDNLKAVLRADDTLARLGGDEFVVLLVDVAGTEECALVLERLLAAIQQEVCLGDAVVRASASIGVSLYPQDNADADTLLRHADQAMYLAKDAGKNRYQMFDPESDRKAQAHRKELELLRHALDNDEFVLYYQPKVDLENGDIIGAEALIRWRHPERGLLAPDAFLPLLHGSELENAVDEWVINTALAQASAWHDAGLVMRVSVNVSAGYLLAPTFYADLARALHRHGNVPPAHLELEVLETAAIADMEQAVAILQRCRQLGVHFALDDFGTGYSSLTYLRKLPVDTLKIDQSFVRDMLIDADDLGIVEGVIQLATVFERQVIAEGVETLQHGAVLRRLGCRLVQGYGIARPLAADAFPHWCRQWQSDAAWRALTEAS
ncbi:EAL domain-containing protein [Vogesella indigofera]|uniref:EAL domain-containing protein n=1 Tax=Vogesella indigofera TaxID=45465 RepID=UPI00234E59B4|nr:EAL domain-containing protein [Vogesella indigofera]MDC7696307.1 EAL domain-containing protein [Vogesella indigofera]